MTGKERWKYTIESGFLASPAYADGRVFVGDYDGRFHCVDAKTGDKQWIYEAGGEINSSGNFYQGNVLFGSQDATLYCLNVDGRQSGLETHDPGSDSLLADVGGRPLLRGRLRRGACTSST